MPDGEQPAPRPHAVLSRAFDWALAAAVVVIWYHRFGPMGPLYNSDTAVTGAMALRPFTRDTFYFWGGRRQGSFVSWAAVPLVLGLHLDAAEAGQLVSCFCSAVALALFLSWLRAWPWKLVLAAFFAFPKFRLAEMICGQGSMMPATLLFLALELRSFERTYRAPTPAGAARTGLWLGFALWCGENVVPIVPLQLALVGLRRGSAGARERLRLGGATLGGLALPALFIAAGKVTGKYLKEYMGILSRKEAWDNVVNLDWQLTHVLSSLTAHQTEALALAECAISAVVLLAAARRREPSSPALAQAAPLAVAMGIETCFSNWYAFGGWRECYFTTPMALLMVGSVWSADAFTSRWRGRPGLALRVLSLPLALWLARGLYRQGRADDDDLRSDQQGPRWRQRVWVAEALDCKGVVGSYWDSYVYFTLSQGEIIAGAKEGDARVDWLTREALRQPVVCVVPWWTEPGCLPTLKQYGQTLKLIDERVAPKGTADPGQPSAIRDLRFCAYRRR